MFIPEKFTINDGFIESFDSIEIFLDGYLSRFEIELLQEVAKKREVVVIYVLQNTIKNDRKIF